MNSTETPDKKKGNWVFVPIPVSNPTVGTGVQAVLMYLHPKKSEEAPNPTTAIGGMYTSTDSWFVGGFHDNNFFDDRMRLRVVAGYGDFNLDFYGIGDVTFPGDGSVPWEIKGTVVNLRSLFRIGGTKYWFIGPEYVYLDADITFKVSQNYPQLPDITGPVTTAGLGLVLMYDSRDDNYYPTHGQYSVGTYTDYGEQWGGDFEYEKFVGFYNAYIPVVKNLVFAAQTRLDTSSEGTPFFNLAYLDMLGFPQNRYLDQYSLSAGAELRYKFKPRWGVVGFYQVGWINDELKQITSGTRVTSYGFGLRWQATRDKKLNLGLTAAWSTDDKALYLQIGEDF